MTTQVNTEAVVAEPDDKPATGPGWQELVGRLVAQARVQGLELTGQGRLLQQLTKRVLEPVLGREITDHLGRDQHERAGEGWCASRRECVVTSVCSCPSVSALATLDGESPDRPGRATRLR